MALDRMPPFGGCHLLIVSVAAIAFFIAAPSSPGSGCAQGYQAIFHGEEADESVSSLLQTRASASGSAGRQLTDDAFRRKGVYVDDHNCSWAARQPPWVEIEGGCTITAIEHCWHTASAVVYDPSPMDPFLPFLTPPPMARDSNDCYDTYNHTLTRGQRSFTVEETILRIWGASCARGKGCAADGWEDGPPFGTRKLGEVLRCWAPSPGEEEWLPQSTCDDVDACFKTVDPYEAMQEAVESWSDHTIDWRPTWNDPTSCFSISPQTCANATGPYELWALWYQIVSHRWPRSWLLLSIIASTAFGLLCIWIAIFVFLFFYFTFFT